MPTTVAVGEKLPDIQNAAKTIGNGITLLIGAGLITLALYLAPEEWDQRVLAIGAGLTALAELLVTWSTRNAATVPIVVDPGTVPVPPTVPPTTPVL